MTGYIIVLISITISSVSQLLLKKGASKSYDSFIKQYLNPYVIIGYGLMFISLFLTMLAFRFLPFKLIPALESLGFIFVMLLSRLFFREPLTRNKIAGTCIILLGICIYHI